MYIAARLHWEPIARPRAKPGKLDSAKGLKHGFLVSSAMFNLIVGCMLGLASFLAMAGLPSANMYYEYVLFLHGDANGAALAQATAMTTAPMTHHQLTSPESLRSWKGQGKIPIAFEQRSFNGQSVMGRRAIDEARIFDTDESLREILRLPSPKPVKALAVMVGKPQEPNIPAYIEALALSASVAKAVKSPAFLDEQTTELLRLGSLERRLTEGQLGGDNRINAANPPHLTIMDGVTSFKRLEGRGIQTLGMNKLGLPDLKLADWIPGFSELEVVQLVGKLMLCGKAAPVAGATFEFRTDDPDVLDAFPRPQHPAQVVKLKFGVNKNNSPGERLATLAIEFPGTPGLHLYERQMLVLDKLWASPYRVLGKERAQELSLAVARTRGQLHDLRVNFAKLRATGTRIYVAWRMDLIAQAIVQDPDSDSKIIWEEVLEWTPDGSMKLRRWKGDPRFGGSVLPLNPPIKIDGEVFRFMDSDTSEDVADDILLVSGAGKATGGKVTALMTRYAKEIASAARPRAPVTRTRQP